VSRRKKKPLIVVLGMHRSGTSAITRGLEVLGVSLGDELMPPAPDNETGFFEDREINALNVELLRSLGHDWDTLGPITARELTAASLLPLQQRAIQVLRVKLRGHPIFGIKDPRLSRLLPFWKRVFQRLSLEARYVIAIRNPLSVARSLDARNQIASEKCYYLWLEHVVSSILDTKGSKRLVVDYDRLLDKPHTEMERMATTLRLPQPTSAELMGKYSQQYLNEDMQHSRFRLRDLAQEATVCPEIVEAFKLLSEVASDRTSLDTPVVERSFKRFQVLLSSAAPAFHLINEQERGLSSLREALSERDSQFAFVEGVLVQRNNDLEAARNAASAYARELTILEGQLDSAQVTAIEMQNELEAGSKQLDERDRRLTDLTTQFEAIAAEIKVRDEESAVARETLEQLKNDIEERSSQLEARDQELVSSREAFEHLRGEIEEKSSQLEILFNENRSLKEQLELGQAELGNRGSALESANRKREKLEALLEQRTQHIDELNSSVAAVRNSLDATLKHVRNELEAKSAQLTALGSENRSLQSRLESASGRVASFETHAHEAQQTINQLREEVDTLRRAIEDTARGILGVTSSLESAVDRRTPGNRH
jgi:hypothetical protein